MPEQPGARGCTPGTERDEDRGIDHPGRLSSMPKTRMTLVRGTAMAAFAAALLLIPAERAAAQADSVTVAAGARYGAGGFRAWLLGSDYRDLWTAPIRVPVLELDTFGGGLTPVERGSGLQTISLRLRASDGREYNFRSVDKDQSGGLHPDFRGTLIGRIAQDQVSSKHPASALIVSRLLDAAGVLHPRPRLFVMPDDPRLGEFRDIFAGMLGTLEVHPDEGAGDEGLFEGASRVAGTDRLIEHLDSTAENRVESREYLRARLVDLLVGDWDRHPGQWRWARYDGGGTRWWSPVPEDRDNALSSYDGLLLDVARAGAPRLVEFGPEYPDLFGLTENAQELDRRLLSGLGSEVFGATAEELADRITDDVIASAVASTPPDYWALRGEEIAAWLRARRDALPGVARAFHAQLAREVDVHATDERDLARVYRQVDGSVRVELYRAERTASAGGGAAARDEPYFHRELLPAETREVRIYLRGGDDRAVVLGSGAGPIRVRVIGGAGDDVLADSSAARGGVPPAFYDAAGRNTIVASRRTVVDTRAYEPPPRPISGFNENVPGNRDWGTESSRFVPRAEWRYNLGPVIGGGPRRIRYGFRRAPYAHSYGARVLYAPMEGRWGLEADADVRRTGSPSHATFRAYATELEVVRFHGYGNRTPGAGSPTVYRVPEATIGFEPTYHHHLGDGVVLWSGLTGRYTSPEPELDGPASDLRPVGSDPFWRIGGRIGITLDNRDRAAFPSRGVRATMGGSAFAPVGRLPGGFGSAEAVGSIYLPLPLPMEATLALRTGGRQAWGDFPFQEAAFIGGAGTVRGHPLQRWAGDASVFGGVELRAFLTRFNFVSRGDLGLIALADAGRVFVDGESPGGWHTGLGGGLWIGILDRARTVSVVAAHGSETALYFAIGMPF
jgi:hypothetical protein